MNFILHIGTHKTGSTALQSFLFANRKKLLELGVLYPKSGLVGNAHHLVAETLKSGDIEKAQALFSKIEQEAIELGVDKILLSSETFEFIRNDKLLNSFFQKIPNTKTIVFLRRPDHFLESEYNQHIKMYKLRYQHDIYRFYYRFDFVRRFDYALLCRRWAKFSQLQAINYDHCLTEPLGIFKALLASIAIDWQDDFLIPTQNESNIRIPNIATLYLARMNKLNLSPVTHQTAVRIIAQKFADTPKQRLLPYEDKLIIWRRFISSINFVVKHYGVIPFSKPCVEEDANLPPIHFYDDFNEELFQQFLSQVKR